MCKLIIYWQKKEPEQNLMGEYENNSTTNNYTSENDLALSITIYD